MQILTAHYTTWRPNKYKKNITLSYIEMSETSALDAIMERAAEITNSTKKNEGNKRDIFGGAPKKLGRPRKSSKSVPTKKNSKKGSKKTQKVQKKSSKKGSKKSKK
jgi:hypothetical protein